MLLRDDEAGDAGDGHRTRRRWGRVTPTPRLGLKADPVLPAAIPEFGGDFDAGFLGGVQTEDGVLSVGVVEAAARHGAVGPGAVRTSRAHQPFRVALNEIEVLLGISELK